jgi:hypothetical protein
VNSVIGRVGFLGALSFEERCSAALTSWLEAESSQNRFAQFFSYDDKATPDVEANMARETNWERIRKLAAAARLPLERERLDPYSMGDLEGQIAAIAEQVDEIVLDLSCFTKLHLMAAARAVLRLDDSTGWSVTYSRPYSYGDLNAPKARGGWLDTLVLPLGDDPSLTNQGMALGVVLAGMEADRTAIALNELEPASGLIIFCRSVDRPDLQRLTIANNSLLLAHLQGLRMPGPQGKRILPYFSSGGWEVEKIQLEFVVDELGRCLGRIVNAAEAIAAPVILFPFGPKIAVFLASLYLARHYPQASWTVYPIPKTHPIDYSDGVRGTDWYSGATLLDALNKSYAIAVSV